MIPFYGKHYAKQYIKGKPIRFGFKNWALQWMLDLFRNTVKGADTQKRFGIGGDMVVTLINQANIPPNKGYKIFFGNYFSATGMVYHWAHSGYFATGTIQDG